LAIALNCFERYCRKHALSHPAIDSFLDDLWEFPLVDSQRWDEWESRHPSLVNAAFGDPWPEGFEEFLATRRIRQSGFRELISSIVEIVFSSFYGAANTSIASEFFSMVIRTMKSEGIDLPPLDAFACSRFADRGGWGMEIGVSQRSRWRAVTP